MSLRRSARLAPKVPSSSHQTTEPTIIMSEPVTVPSPFSDKTKRKLVHDKAKKNPEAAYKKIKKGKSRAGKLRNLPEMPLDILFEIFGQLHPLDVLKLARTTKALRNILMRRSSTSVWRAACANVGGFPDCPTDLALPQWVSLAFETHCHDCGRRGPTSKFWVYRKRLCKTCLKTGAVEIIGLGFASEFRRHPINFKAIQLDIIPEISVKRGRES
ncbi:hypothetical protein HGRIS_013729 [Hohenbuehelia grisea]|uniref:F-box domain-containing protein n=1 Tax=Hohenbuehelia grisea TaxID=104357 RepID=A0ABR3IWK7_9AGAR